MFYITLEYSAYRESNRIITDVKEFRAMFLDGCEEGKMDITKSKNVVEALYQANIIVGVRTLKVYLSPAQFANYALTMDVNKRSPGDGDFTVVDANYEVTVLMPSQFDASHD